MSWEGRSFQAPTSLRSICGLAVLLMDFAPRAPLQKIDLLQNLEQVEHGILDLLDGFLWRLLEDCLLRRPRQLIALLADVRGQAVPLVAKDVVELAEGHQRLSTTFLLVTCRDAPEAAMISPDELLPRSGSLLNNLHSHLEEAGARVVADGVHAVA